MRQRVIWSLDTVRTFTCIGPTAERFGFIIMHRIPERPLLLANNDALSRHPVTETPFIQFYCTAHGGKKHWRLISPGKIAVSTSKGAVDTLTKGLATETAAENIRVNDVWPRLIYTDMHAGDKPKRGGRLKTRNPMLRGGQLLRGGQSEKVA